MSEIDRKIVELENRLDNLVRTQIGFQNEITTIRRELSKLRSAGMDVNDEIISPPASGAPDTAPMAVEPTTTTWTISDPPRKPIPPVDTRAPSFGVPRSAVDENEPAPESAFTRRVNAYTESARSDLEKFIGENLISKVGIIILVLGVGIGGKYAIDNGWISPLLRMIFGYVMGFGLLGAAVKLKSKYHDFSAVLVSGGMAILYFVTFFAYAYYSLMPQGAAFPLMVMFTAFTIAAALLYDRQIIAHIGLVGAYAVPFLLSNNTGNYLFLFVYMTIVNVGVLAILIKRLWRPLFYTSSAFTWLIFAAWFSTKYIPTDHLYLALTFLGIFFAGFYATKVIQGLVHPRSNDAENLASIMATGFVFYVFLFAISDVPAEPLAYSVIFTFLAVFSLAILLTSYRFYGRVFVFLSCPSTWAIYIYWFANRYTAESHMTIAIVFACVFFGVYYGATLIYRIVTDDIGVYENAALTMTNSFVFYGAGYAILDSREDLRAYEGLYTAGHGGMDLLVSNVVDRVRSTAVDVVQVLTVLIITFATIAIPVQFDGNAVTLVWTVEAAVLFWFGRTRVVPLFEYCSLPLMCLASGSLILDWLISSTSRTMTVSDANLPVFANGDLVTAAVFVNAFAFIYVVNRESSDKAAIPIETVRPLGMAAATAAVLVLYNMFRIEIGNYFHLRVAEVRSTAVDESARSVIHDLGNLNTLWQIDYTMLFLSLMGSVNIQKIRSTLVAYVNVIAAVFFLFAFSTLGMQMFLELRATYISNGAGFENVVIRWISYVFAAGLIFALFKYRDESLLVRPSKDQRRLAFDAVLYTTLLITLSCELLHLMAQFGIKDGAKLGLSILWGVYALFLIILGIRGAKKHLRIAAIALLGVTLVKLFIYDIADLPTIPKTILFVSLGGLMLIVSFLYNKYKHLIFSADDDEDA